MNAAAANSEPAASALAVSVANSERDPARAALRAAPDAVGAREQALHHDRGTGNDGAAAMPAARA